MDPEINAFLNEPRVILATNIFRAWLRYIDTYEYIPFEDFYNDTTDEHITDYFDREAGLELPDAPEPTPSPPPEDYGEYNEYPDDYPDSYEDDDEADDAGDEAAKNE